jgi:hypothetical protein
MKYVNSRYRDANCCNRSVEESESVMRTSSDCNNNPLSNVCSEEWIANNRLAKSFYQPRIVKSYRLRTNASLLPHDSINFLNSLLNPSFNPLNKHNPQEERTLTSRSTCFILRSASLTATSPPVNPFPSDKYPCQSSSINFSISFSSLSTHIRSSERKSSRVRN